ncbi:MAG: lipoate---protein ligase, partial [Acidimicrobiaceae bacterium]
RRGGGGAVYLEPSAALWVDVVVPRGDELWNDDIGRATYWLGEAWAAAIGGHALVLGSRQAMVDIPGIEVVRRRSGGGAVHLAPGGTLWVDVVVPRGDDLWDDDVSRATYWLGDAWAEAIGDRAVVHRGAMVRNEWSDLVCFCGLGPGEVTIDGRKVVGISQRRTREAARFQCVTYERWDPEPLARWLHIDAPLETVGSGVGPLTRVEDAFVAALG